MSIPPDFTRRVQENPQIAVELYEALKETAQALAWLYQGDYCGYSPHVCPPPTALRRARRALDRVAETRTAHAHYAKELALDAAARTGEEVLPEHTPSVPGME